MSKKTITIAVPKGYLFQETITILKKAGIHFNDTLKDSRKLFTYDSTKTYKMILVRPWDVPAYVEQGAADFGVVGRDVLNEHSADVLILNDLGFGGCRLVIAGNQDQNINTLPHNCKVVTKYPNSTASYFNRLGKKVRIIKLYGAIELGPLTGLSDVICDLTATGSTLAEHDLKVLDTVFESTAHLIANPIGMRSYYKEITTLCNLL